MRLRHAIGAVAVVVVAAAATPARGEAVTLMVNGDTPSKRWQRPFTDARAMTPTPNGNVDLYFAPCPTEYEFDVAGCAHLSSTLPAPRIYVEPATVEAGPSYVVVTIAHELGHVVDWLYLTESDRQRFAGIWRRPPGLAWDEQLAPPAPIIGSDGYHGGPSSAREWFADVYQACTLNAWTVDRLEALEFIDTKREARLVAWRYRRIAKRQINASCRLIEDAALRSILGP